MRSLFPILVEFFILRTGGNPDTLTPLLITSAQRLLNCYPSGTMDLQTPGRSEKRRRCQASPWIYKIRRHPDLRIMPEESLPLLSDGTQVAAVNGENAL